MPEFDSGYTGREGYFVVFYQQMTVSNHYIYQLEKLQRTFPVKYFGQCYAWKVGKGFQEGNDAVAVDMRDPVMKELRAQWLPAFHSHMQSHSDLQVNVFRNAGIMEAIKTDIADLDLFADCD